MVGVKTTWLLMRETIMPYSTQLPDCHTNKNKLKTEETNKQLYRHKKTTRLPRKNMRKKSDIVQILYRSFSVLILPTFFKKGILNF